MQKFENESCVVEATEEPGCLLSLRIHVKTAAVQKAYKQAVRAVNKRISIPGFRKGKAPDATVISRYGAYVESEWKENVVNEAYQAGLKLTGIYPLSKDSIKKPKIESCTQEAAEISLAFEHYPEVPVVDFSAITIPPLEVPEISEARVQEVLEEVRRATANWETIEGRAVQEGDYVDITIEAIDEDPPKPIVTDRRFDMNPARMAPWLYNLLLGAQSGETREGMSEVDPNATEEIKKKFKSTQVRVMVNAIQKILLPEVDEEFAKRVGASSLEDLFAKIKQNLEREALDDQQQKQIRAMEDALLEKYEFDLPASVVESERRERIKIEIQNLKEEGLSDAEIQARGPEIEKSVDLRVNQSLRLYFLNKQIAKQGNIALTNQELNDELVKQISQNPGLYDTKMDKERSEELISKMANRLLQRKTKEYALGQIQQQSLR